MVWQLILVSFIFQLGVYEYLKVMSSSYSHSQTQLLEFASHEDLLTREAFYLGKLRDLPLPRLDYGAFGSYSLAICILRDQRPILDDSGENPDVITYEDEFRCPE